MKLPDQFRMRLNTFPGYTHRVKKNAHGDYEVTWARGFPNKIGSLPQKVWAEDSVVAAVMVCRWIIVDDTPKAEDKKALPDVFCFKTRVGVYQATKVRDKTWNVVLFTQRSDSTALRSDWPEDEMLGCLCVGIWQRCEAPKELTAEQKRFNAEYREQIRALGAFIKIAQQAEEHQRRLQENYKSRIEEIKAKIVSDPSETIVEDV